MPTVLVTGASRGIGKAIVDHLAARGWDVIAGVRTEEDAAGFGPGVSPVLLDVTDETHIALLDSELPDRLDAVVNNAGVVVDGPMEAVATADLRRQLDINVVGQIAVTQAVLARLRRSKGRIVFISSVNGQISMPLLGSYCASKFALEACADAMRMELRPWGIGVSIVEPAQTDTDLWRHADAMVQQSEAALSSEHRELYGKHISGWRKSIPMSQKLAVPAVRVAESVERALTDKRPRARYVVGLIPRAQLALLGVLPTRAKDQVLRRTVRQP